MKPKFYYSLRGQAVVEPELRAEWKEKLPHYLESSKSDGKDVEEAINIMEQLNKGISCKNIKYLYGRDALGDSSYALTLSLTATYCERGNEFKALALGEKFVPDVVQKSADYIVSREQLIADAQAKGAQLIKPDKIDTWNRFVEQDYSYGSIFSGSQSDGVIDILSSLKEHKTWEEIREPFSVRYDRPWGRADIGATIEQLTDFKGVSAYLAYGGVEPQFVKNNDEYIQYLTDVGQSIFDADKQKEWEKFVTEDFRYHFAGQNAQSVLDTARLVDYFEDLSMAKNVYNSRFEGNWGAYIANQTEKFSGIQGLADYFVKDGPQPSLSRDGQEKDFTPEIGDR